MISFNERRLLEQVRHYKSRSPIIIKNKVLGKTERPLLTPGEELLSNVHVLIYVYEYSSGQYNLMSKIL